MSKAQLTEEEKARRFYKEYSELAKKHGFDFASHIQVKSKWMLRILKLFPKQLSVSTKVVSIKGRQ